jgi:hypothetical protein
MKVQRVAKKVASVAILLWRVSAEVQPYEGVLYSTALPCAAAAAGGPRGTESLKNNIKSLIFRRQFCAELWE